MIAKHLKRLALVVVLAGTTVVLSSHAEIIDDDTPVPPVGEFGGPFRVLTPEEMEQFIRGRRIFDRDWKLSQGLGADLERALTFVS